VKSILKTSLLISLVLVVLGLSSTVALASQKVYFQGIAGKAQVRPTLLILTADGSLDVIVKSWSRWGNSTAIGQGVAYYYTCDNACVFHGAPRTAGHENIKIELYNRKEISQKDYYQQVKLTKSNGKELDASYLSRQLFGPEIVGLNGK
jgi:hypothetical protein